MLFLPATVLTFSAPSHMAGHPADLISGDALVLQGVPGQDDRTLCGRRRSDIFGRGRRAGNLGWLMIRSRVQTAVVFIAIGA